MNLTEPVKADSDAAEEDRRRMVVIAVIVLPLASAVCSLAVLCVVLLALV